MSNTICHRCQKPATVEIGGVMSCDDCARIQPHFLRPRKLHHWLPWLCIALALPGCRWFQRPAPDNPPIAEFRGATDEGFVRYEQLTARVFLELANRLQSGAITTEAGEQKFLGERWEESRVTAFEKAMTAEQDALGSGKWTPQIARAYWLSLARECDPDLEVPNE